jgi:growth factor-regulated tyrosine kinase substrate
VVRYYDRMLEERLSKAYSQHSIGGYHLPPPRQASGPYPSLQPSAPSAPSAAGPAESFYAGEQQQDYSRPAAQPSYPQPTPQPQYAAYDRRASAAGPSNQYPPQQMPQHTGSWGPAQTPQYNQQPAYPPHEATPPQAGQLQQTPAPAQLSAPTANDSVGTTPTADPSASFYFNPQQSQQPPQQAPSSPPDPAISPYPNLAQPMHSYQPSLPQTPASVQAQPTQPQPTHQAPPQQAQQQPYWQHPAAQQTQLPPVWQAAPPSAAYAGYTQESFPSAPQHAPKQPVVEESLIDL